MPGGGQGYLFHSSPHQKKSPYETEAGVHMKGAYERWRRGRLQTGALSVMKVFFYIMLE